MKEKSYSQPRACALAGIDPRVYRRTSKRPADTELRARMKELASERRRFGYRRLSGPAEAGGLGGELEDAVPALPRGRVNRS